MPGQRTFERIRRLAMYAFVVLFFVLHLCREGSASLAQVLSASQSAVPVSQAPMQQGITYLFPPGVAAVPDGEHGAYILWEDHYNWGIFVQRFGPDSQPVWQAGGIDLNSPPVQGDAWRVSPRGVPDSQGGVIAGWIEYGIRAQRLNAGGEKLWSPNGINVTSSSVTQGYGGLSMIADGMGGAIFASTSDSNFLLLQRVNGNGELLWPDQPVQLPYQTWGPPTLVSDGAGGVIVVLGPVVKAYRINAAGQWLWGDGVEIGQRPWYFPAAVADGVGGAIVAWSKYLGDADLTVELLAQRLDSNGNLLWGTGGVSLALAPGGRTHITMISDGTGGAVVTWADEREVGYSGCSYLDKNCDIYAQRISASGQVAWQQNGVPLTRARAWQGFPMIAEDGQGGAFVVWQDCRNYLDPLDPQQCYPNPANGYTGKGMDLYGQHITATGKIDGPLDGLPVSAAPGVQGALYGSRHQPGIAVTSDGAGNVFVVWPDGRDDICAYTIFETECDVYVQHLIWTWGPKVYLPLMHR